jgi:hypothetical protein
MLRETSVECRALLAKLNNIVQTEDTMHICLNDGISNDLEVFPGINLNLKVKIKDRCLPLTISFLYYDERRKDLTVFTS